MSRKAVKNFTLNVNSFLKKKTFRSAMLISTTARFRPRGLAKFYCVDVYGILPVISQFVLRLEYNLFLPYGTDKLKELFKSFLKVSIKVLCFDIITR